MSILLFMLNWSGPVEGVNTPFLTRREKAWITTMLSDAGLLGEHNIELEGYGYADNWQDADSMSLIAKTFNEDKNYNDTEWILVDTFGEMMMHSEISYPFGFTHKSNLAHGYRSAKDAQQSFDVFKGTMIENIEEELYNRSHEFFGHSDTLESKRWSDKVFRITPDALIIKEVSAGRDMQGDGDGGYEYGGWLHWNTDLDWNKVYVEAE